ncbi:MAG: hypothetical protein XU15_C0011G0081 [candidate division NC10 bacterium CSP1-5]|nr:MAG: hypothetical protein XU15_C0011G0081 [candidate division NC10 bacterium CSP1-5]
MSDEVKELVFYDWSEDDLRREFRTLLKHEPTEAEMKQIIGLLFTLAERIETEIIDTVQAAIREAGISQ